MKRTMLLWKSFAAFCRKSKTDSFCRTGVRAGAAPDALRRIRRFHGIDFHFTYLLAFPAADTLVAVHFQMKNADFIAQAVDGSQRAEYPAEKAVKKDTADECHNENGHFQAEQCTHCISEAFVGSQKKQPAFQCSGRADILTESRLTRAHVVGDRHRQDQDEDNEHHVLDVQESLFQMPFRRGDLVDQLLQQAERT